LRFGGEVVSDAFQAQVAEMTLIEIAAGRLDMDAGHGAEQIGASQAPRAREDNFGVELSQLATT
jgi:hypothetical protein